MQLHLKSLLLFLMMIIYYRGSKMIDLQSADSGLDKVWPNIDAVLNALLAFQITTLCPISLLFFVGCWFDRISRIFYTCRCSISCTSECLEWKIHISALLGSKKPFWLKLGKPLILVTFWESHLRNDLRIRCHLEKFINGFLSQTSSFFKSQYMCGEVRNKFLGKKSM